MMDGPDLSAVYHAHAARAWYLGGLTADTCTKSWRHSDGSLVLGGGGFVVAARLSTGWVVDRHLARDWDLFDIPEVETAPETDGTPEQMVGRLLEALR